MTARIWKGGGNNSVSNPKDWRAAGAPRPGDTLSVSSQLNQPPKTYIMNVHTYGFAGNPITIGSPYVWRTTLTVNMDGRAIMSASMVNADATFNLSQRSSLNLTVNTGAHVGTASAVINMSNQNYLWLTNNESPVTVNLAPNSLWAGSLTMGYFGQLTRGLTTVNGGSGSAFYNGGSTIGYDATAVINTDVVGTGNFDLTANFTFARPKLEFGASVAATQTVSDQGLVQIDRPNAFLAAVTLQTGPVGPNGPAMPAEIDLMGLATADSYTFVNDSLSIFSGNSVIDTLRLHDATLSGFTVQKGASSVNIIAITDPTNVPAGLPVHVG